MQNARRSKKLANPKPAVTNPQITSTPVFAVLSVVSILTLLISLPTLNNGAVDSDDPLYIKDALASQGITPEGITFALTSLDGLYWHPLTWLSHELDFELFGSSLYGHHFTSVLLHALTAGLLCFLCLQLGAGAYQAVAASLLWALHPLRVESFAWLAERKDVLCAFFFVASLVAYLRYAKQPSRARYALWLGCGVLALLAKPTAVTLPLVLLLLDYWPLRRTAQPLKLLVEKITLAAMAIVVAVLTAIGQQHAGATSLVTGISLGTRIANATVSYATYLGKILWPVNLACFYPYDRHPEAAWVIASTCLLAAITGVAVLRRNRWPWLLVGWLWFVITLLPNSGIIQAGRQGMADRFTELGSMGLTIAIVWTAVAWAGAQPRRQVALAWSAGIIIVVLGALTVRQIGYWRDTVTLFEHAVAVADCDYSRGNLAVALNKQGRYQEGEIHLRKAIQLAPNEADYHVNLAGILVRTGRLEDASLEAQDALRLAPDKAITAETAGVIALRRGFYQEAVLRFDQAARLGFDRNILATALNDTGASLASRGQPANAELLIRKAVDLNPGLVQARRNLVLVLEDQGRRDEATKALQEAIQATGRQRQYTDLIRELEPTGSSRPR
ncbi:MAG TPA: tetratricopeptide repeat protein [Bryobacteraceae bacterium]|jgi:Flp pilus assembly protein TadD|nr:tetratricopeptide repeat protein [Bryobacteraceae bacterium]